MCYYIALIASLFGFHEIPLHLGFLLPACTAAIGIFYLAKYFHVDPFFASLCSILSPVFLISSTTLMCDTAMLAFWLWAVICWLYGLKHNRKSILLLSSVLISLCILTKYFGIALLPLLLFYAIAERKKFRSYILFLAIPLIFVLLYQWYTAGLYGQGLITNAFAYSKDLQSILSRNKLHKMLVGLSFTGGCLLPVLLLSFTIWPRRVIIAAIPAIIGFICILSFLKNIGQTQLEINGNTRWFLLTWFSILTAGGISILSLAIAEFLQKRNSSMLLMLLWITGTLIFACFINWTVSTRNLLPLAPPVGILIALRIQRLRKRILPRHVCLLLMAGLIALAAARADYVLAGASKKAADYIRDTYGGQNCRIWFQGHWGFQYYMQQAGFQALDFNNSIVQPGDIIVTPLNNTNIKAFPERLVSLHTVKRFSLPGCITVMNKNIEAGFYLSIWGIVPFMPKSSPDEVYLIHEVNPSD